MSFDDKTSFETIIGQEWLGDGRKLERREGIRHRLTKPLRIAFMAGTFSVCTALGIGWGVGEVETAKLKLDEHTATLEDKKVAVQKTQEGYSANLGMLDMYCRSAVQQYLPSGVLGGVSVKDALEDLGSSGVCMDVVPGYLWSLRSMEDKLMAQQAKVDETENETEAYLNDANEIYQIWLGGLVGITIGVAASTMYWHYHKDPNEEFTPQYSEPNET